jgi:hypothetical protein
MKTSRLKQFLLFMLPLMFLPLVPLEAIDREAVDFGLTLNNYFGAYNNIVDIKGQQNEYDYRFDVLPYALLYLSDTSELYMSVRISLGLEKIGQEGKNFYYLPEITRTELSMRIGNWGINAGRIYQADPLGFIATGLFDGIRFTHISTDGNISIGTYYTGLLYKKSANVAMTAEEQAHYDKPLDYTIDNIYDSYFAPRHVLLSFDYEHPSFLEKLQIKAAITEQMDFSKMEGKYHSQYFTLKASLPYKSFTFDFGTSFEMSLSILEGDVNYSNAFAFDGGIYWMLPTKFSSRLSLIGRYGGQMEQGVFIPVTNKFYGNVLKARLPGISLFSLDYSLRPIRSLRTSLSLMYFVRNDLWTYAGYPVDIQNNEGKFLGPEIFTRLIWNPFSDLQINLGGGMFLPALGNVNREAKSRWYVELSVAFTIL